MDFNNTGAMRSPFSPRVRQSISGRRGIGLSSAKKNQSDFMQPEQSGDVVYKTPLMTVETYGPPLPVTVTEALTFSSGDISVRLSPCGWCWLVAGRRLLAWPLQGGAAARELTLPQTDLAHKADLVVIYYEDGAQMPSCIGVSPEGAVRYWASVGQEMYVESCCELAGQECDRLVQAGPHLLLATTTCSLVLLRPELAEGRATVSCRTLRPPSGWLGGIGRRVSHLIFGAMPHQDTKLAGVVGVAGGVALVAGGAALQLWRGAALGELHEHSLRAALGERLAGEGEPLVLDVQRAGEHALLVLAARAGACVLAQVSVRDPAAPRVLGAAAVRARGQEAPRVLALGARALLHAPGGLALAGGGDGDALALAAEGDRLLGAAALGERALLLTRKHGLLLLTVAPEPDAAPAAACDTPVGSPCPSDMYEGNLTLYEIDPHELVSTSSDPVSGLQAAVVLQARGAAAAAGALLRELFPALQEEQLDAPLDRAVITVAERLLDDAPAGDPRWAGAAAAGGGVALGASAALQVRRQLADKRRALGLLLATLRAHGLLPRLRRLSAPAGPQATPAALHDRAERLEMAAALHDLHAMYPTLIDDAMYQVVCGSETEEAEEAWVVSAVSTGVLSAAEACYRRVTRMPCVLRALCRARAPAAARLLAAVLRRAAAARRRWPLPAAPAPRLPLLRAAAALLPAALAGDDADAEAAAALAAALLEDAAPLQRPDTDQIYRDLRRDIIRPFLAAGRRGAACALAEQHGELELLVQLCAETEDYDRLKDYIDKYADQGMGEVAYAWLSSRGGRGAAALLRRLGGARLGAWLGAAPARAHLLPLHLLQERQAGAAAAALAALAAQAATLPRRRTAAALGKLCALAEPGEPAVLGALGGQLELCARQAALPAALARHHGLDGDQPPLLAPEELMQIYISCDSGGLTEQQYLQALELAPLVQDERLRDALVLQVWCACAVHSAWTREQDNMFSRLLHLHLLHEGAHSVPRLQQLLGAPELQELLRDVTVQHRLQCALHAALPAC